MLDLCSAPGGKTSAAARRRDRGRARPEPRERAAREPRSCSARRTSPSSRRTGRSCRPSSTGFDRALVDAPCSGLGVLSQRPDLRWRAKPLPELQLALLRSAAERVRPGGTIVYSVCTINADENEAVVDASGLEVAAARRGVAAVRASAPAGVPAHAAACPRHERVLHRADCSCRPVRVDRVAAWPGANWIRTVEIEPSLYAADFAHLGEQIDVLLRTGARVFHFDVGDGHFVEPITIGPIVLRVDLAARARDRAACSTAI